MTTSLRQFTAIAPLTFATQSCKSMAMSNLPSGEKQGSTICIGGLISVGKSTFIEKLAERSQQMHLTCHVMSELLSPSLCAQLPTDPIIFDSFMFGHRMQMSIDAKQIARSYDLVLMERCFIDHLAFLEAIARIGWAPRHYAEMCRNIVREMAPPKPDHFVFLDIPAEIAYERMRKRGEKRDANFTLQFFETLRTGYMHAIDTYYKRPIVIEWSRFGEELDIEKFIRSLTRARDMLF